MRLPGALLDRRRGAVRQRTRRTPPRSASFNSSTSPPCGARNILLGSGLITAAGGNPSRPHGNARADCRRSVGAGGAAEAVDLARLGPERIGAGAETSCGSRTPGRQPPALPSRQACAGSIVRRPSPQTRRCFSTPRARQSPRNREPSGGGRLPEFRPASRSGLAIDR